MELCDIAQEEPQETDWMVELAREYFKDGKEAFQKLLDWERKDPDGSDIARELLVILNPTKFKMIRSEYANVMMTEHTIKVMPYRNHGEIRNMIIWILPKDLRNCSSRSIRKT